MVDGVTLCGRQEVACVVDGVTLCGRQGDPVW